MVSAPFPRKPYIWAFIGIVVVALFPLASVFLTYFIADANGCRVNEAYVQPCLVFGADLGGMFYGTALLGWLALATLPLGAFALGLWFVVLLGHFVWWRTKQRKGSGT